MSDKPMISLDPKLIDNLVKEHLYAAVVSSISGSKDALMRSLCEIVLNLKVNESGQIDSYASNNKFSWLELTFNKEMRAVIKQAIMDQIQAMKPEILS